MRTLRTSAMPTAEGAENIGTSDSWATCTSGPNPLSPSPQLNADTSASNEAKRFAAGQTVVCFKLNLADDSRPHTKGWGQGGGSAVELTRGHTVVQHNASGAG